MGKGFVGFGYVVGFFLFFDGGIGFIGGIYNFVS